MVSFFHTFFLVLFRDLDISDLRTEAVRHKLRISAGLQSAENFLMRVPSLGTTPNLWPGGEEDQDI
jgi:hypothetical protein